MKTHNRVTDYFVDNALLPELFGDAVCNITCIVDVEFCEITTGQSVGEMSWDDTETEFVSCEVRDVKVYDNEDELLFEIEKVGDNLIGYFWDIINEVYDIKFN